MKWKTLSEYPCNYEKKRAAVWKFKIARVSFMNSNTTAQRCYQQPQLEIMLRRTHTHKKKTSLKNEQQKCVLIDIIIHMFLHYFFFSFSFFAKHMLSSSGNVYWFMKICHALFIFLPFFLYLTLAHHSVYIFMLTTSPCWWIFLNVFINKLLLATTTGKQCSTILLLTWTNMLPTWHFLNY